MYDVYALSRCIFRTMEGWLIHSIVQCFSSLFKSLAYTWIVAQSLPRDHITILRRIFLYMGVTDVLTIEADAGEMMRRRGRYASDVTR